MNDKGEKCDKHPQAQSEDAVRDQKIESMKPDQGSCGCSGNELKEKKESERES